MISDIEALGTPVVIVDVENESRFVYSAAKLPALAYYHVRKETVIGRDVEDLRGLSEVQVRGFKYNLSLYRRCAQARMVIANCVTVAGSNLPPRVTNNTSPPGSGRIEST